MKEYRNWAQRLAEAADLPGEAPPGLPLVELLGDNRVLIECHHGVTEYSCEKIGVSVAYGTLRICGSGLKLRIMTRERLVISGRIDGMELIRRS